MDRVKKAEGFKTNDKKCSNNTTPMPTETTTEVPKKDSGAKLTTSTSLITIVATIFIVISSFQ